MSLVDTFEIVRPSIIAFGSKLVRSRDTKPPAFPEIIGTGFVVDARGIVMTNRHVAEALQTLPTNCTMAIVFPKGEKDEVGSIQSLLFRDIVAYNLLEKFESKTPFYGELLPDVAFVQMDLMGVTPLEFDDTEYVLSAGREIATAGFAMGTGPLVRQSRVVQLMPFLRRGVISSLYPFRGPHPHGFTIDIMTQGGESGSPVFLPDTGKVVGMIYGGYDGTNVTIAIPSSILKDAVSTLVEAKLDISASDDLSTAIKTDGKEGELTWKTLGTSTV
jgi:S1-C subfamily serine protease